MASMIPETYTGPYLEIDGPMGVDFIPGDVASIPDDELEQWRSEVDDALLCRLPVPACLKDYCENKDAHDISRCDGSLVRWTMPGCLDCTSWEPGDASDLCDTYEVCPMCYKPLEAECSCGLLVEES